MVDIFRSIWSGNLNAQFEIRSATRQPLAQYCREKKRKSTREREREGRGGKSYGKKENYARKLAKLGDANRQAADTVEFTTHRTSALKYAHNSRIIVSIPGAPYRGQTRCRYSLLPESRNSSVDFADNVDTRALAILRAE